MYFMYVFYFKMYFLCVFSVPTGVQSDQQMELFRILAAVLHLGNINIQASGRGGDRSYIDVCLSPTDTEKDGPPLLMPSHHHKPPVNPQ